MHRFMIVRSIVAAVAFIGCVPAAHYEEAQSAAAVAEEGRRRTADTLASVERELELLQAKFEKAQAQYEEANERLNQYNVAVSQAAYERTTIETQRDEHAELVTRLRGELARIGDHLRVYSDDRTELSEQLQEAQNEIERLHAELNGARPTTLEEEAAEEAADAPAEDGEL